MMRSSSMMLLSVLFRGVVVARNFLYDHKIVKRRPLRSPVLSVGNISAGGSGKTPFVIMLGQLLAERGISFDVLSRGYRRSTRGVLTVNADGSAEDFGDEPLLIARKLQCQVVVGEDRYAAGLKAEDTQDSNGPRSVHLLDDGFQHRRLHRDFDIVLLNHEDLSDALLPLGRLREPLSSVQRAHAIAVDESFPVELLPHGSFQIWRIRRNIEIPEIGGPVIAFCGIARPHRFFSDLREAGIDVREEIAFRDHHRYTTDDMKRLAALQARIPASRFVTTEKDAINLGSHLPILNPVLVAMQMSLIEHDAALKYLLERI